MSYYINTDTKEVRQLHDSLIESWSLANNPKLLEWKILPDKPTEQHQWINNGWILPSPVIPASVSARQIRLWLIQNGFQLSQIDSAIDSIEDTTTRQIVKVEWEYAPYVERSHPMLIPLAAALGLTEEQVDQAFIEASGI